MRSRRNLTPRERGSRPSHPGLLADVWEKRAEVFVSRKRDLLQRPALAISGVRTGEVTRLTRD